MIHWPSFDTPPESLGGGMPAVDEERDEGAWECLDMVRERLEALGMSMEGCPPMMYDDAIKALASRLGRLAGLETWADLRAAVQRSEPPEPYESGDELRHRLDTLTAIDAEYRRTTELHQRSFASVHEAYAVLLEEVDELWDAIKLKERDYATIEKEAIQVGAMVLKLLLSTFRHDSRTRHEQETG